jgi:protein SSD1
LRARRVEAGAITSDNKLKVSFTLDERGNAVDVDRYPHVDSNVLVEEVS